MRAGKPAGLSEKRARIERKNLIIRLTWGGVSRDGRPKELKCKKDHSKSCPRKQKGEERKTLGEREEEMPASLETAGAQ